MHLKIKNFHTIYKRRRKPVSGSLHTCLHFMQAKVAHMKQCAKKNGVSTTKLLELVRDPKSATILLSDEGSQRKLEDLLPKEGVGGGGEFHKLDDLQLAVKGEDDDFKEPFPRLPPKLGRKRKKEDFQEK